MPALERRAAGKELLKKQSQYLGKASCAVPYNAVAIAILNGPLETDVGYLSEAIECGWMCSHRTRLMYNKKAILYTCRRVIAMLKSNGITKL